MCLSATISGLSGTLNFSRRTTTNSRRQNTSYQGSTSTSTYSTNVSQVRSFLGLVNYYGKFLPNLASTLAPLYSFLQKDKHWSWGEAQKRAFVEAKKQLTSDRQLVHYDAAKELLLSCDASPYGIGAVLSHRDAEGQEQPLLPALCQKLNIGMHTWTRRNG